MEARVDMQLRVWRTAGKLLCGAMLWAGVCAQGCAQAGVPQQSVVDELESLAGQAGAIFVGQITSIERRGGLVEVRFRVEQTVAGVAAASFTMREWAGLWPPGHNRYVLGQRVLAFLHGSSGAGFSSPVRGAEGLVPVVVQGLDAPALVDVRRVAASVVRAPGTPLPTEAEGGIALSDVLAVIRPAALASLPGRLPLPVRGRPPLNLPLASAQRRAGVASGVGAGVVPGGEVR